jgi:hypothetical protein
MSLLVLYQWTQAEVMSSRAVTAVPRTHLGGTRQAETRERVLDYSD